VARSNNGTTTNRYSTTSFSGVPTATPLTIACWFNPANLTSNQNLVFVTTATDSDYFGLIWDGANANAQGDNVVLATTAGAPGGDSFGVSPTGGTASAWNHAAAVFTSATSRTAYLNGAGGSANTLSRTPASLAKIYIASFATFSPLNGAMAEVGIWNVALSAADILMLSKGLSPLAVQPDKLVRYWPLYGRAAVEYDLIGGTTLTETGSMVQAAHPLILRPRTQSPPRVTPLAASALNVTGAQTTSATTQTGTIAVIGAVTGAQTTLAATQTATAGVVGAVTGAQTLSACTTAGDITLGTLPALNVTGAQATLACLTAGDIALTPTVALNVTGAQATLACLTTGQIGESVEPVVPSGGGASRRYAKRVRRAIRRRAQLLEEKEERLRALTMERPPMIPAPETIEMLAVVHDQTVEEYLDDDDDEEEELILLLLAS
jgi:Concanavalin A-like lectin/glucanases superfamily